MESPSNKQTNKQIYHMLGGKSYEIIPGTRKPSYKLYRKASPRRRPLIGDWEEERQ